MSEYGGWTCQNCQQFVPWGAVHHCPASKIDPIPAPTPSVVTQRIPSPELERIAEAAERIAAALERIDARHRQRM